MGTRIRQTERERLEAREWLKPIQIAFGDEFLSSRDGRSRYLIVNVGKGKTFGSVQINGQGIEEWIEPSSGSSDRRDIEKIIGHWDFEKIRSAILRRWGNAPPPELRALQEASKQKARLLFP